MPWIRPEPHCIYRQFIDELFQELRLQPKEIITSASEESTLKLVLAGAGTGSYALPLAQGGHHVELMRSVQ